ncbi:tetratricopeptide repeat protein [Malaciobacter mytili]|uniref:tetratricopeptide repeat protein n=1 Tax=Malaciobacter mytili TaxID=603050 RepID=UPI003BAF6C65
MKIAISIFLTLLFLTGCSTLNFQNTVSSKEELINKANKGDIKAMIALNKYYKFPETKEGFDLYNKWYETINKEDKTEDILEFANIFSKYNDMFINGKQKTQHLYNLAVELGSEDALFLQIEAYLKEYNYPKINQIKKKILENPTEEKLTKLYTLYKSKYMNTEASKIIELMTSYGFTYKQTTEEKLKDLIYKKDSQDEINKILEEVIASKDSKEIFQTADYLKKKYKYTYALKLYEAGLLLDNTNAHAYYEASEIYRRGNYTENLKRDENKALESLQKAADYNHFKASAELLREYTKNQENIQDYFNLVEKLKQTKEGKRALAQYYYNNYKKAKANEILNELAQEGDEEAILELALRIPSKYSFNPEEFNLTKKWQKNIIESNNLSLKKKFEEKISSFRFASYYTTMNEELVKKALEEKNIITLRELYIKNRYRNYDIALEYLQTAANYGDVKSNLNLARDYLGSKKDEDINKVLAIYEDLAQKGDINTTRTLAEFYFYPPYTKENFKDYKKAIYYYEKAANMGDLRSIKKLAQIFLCGECESKKLVDYKKAKIYLEKLAQMGEARDLFNLGWTYNFGKGVEKDLLKAKEYYEKAASLGFSSAYYNLAWLYYKDDVIKVDYKKALEYLEKGVELNNSNCINLLGLFYEKGYGVEKNMQTAISYYKQIANFDKYAANNLANYYRDNKNYKEAFKYYEIGSQLGNDESMNELGIIYEQGLGVQKDMQTALNYYNKAYNANLNPHAAYNIGLIYHYAKGGIKKDLQLAKKWYKRSTIDDAKKQLAKIK